ncbi:MAG: restriction endonuclease [Bacteroidales bacterium]|nr:restriction endonuclease [Bacteroidales bacterium]
MIRKRSGEVVPFDLDKLRLSLERSGAAEQDVEAVVNEIRSRLVQGISTHRLYQMAYAVLKKKSVHAAGKYRLKKAIFDLGPTGYPFERFVGELLKYQGYEVEVGKRVKGHCVEHEVDVVAEKDNRRFMIECKFHTDPGRKSDVKVSLYIHSRFLDIEKQWNKQPDSDTRFHQGWIVTNTRFTEDAISYGKCAGLQLISWDYPSQGSLRERIDISGLHPVTALNELTTKEKQEILAMDIVLCRHLKAEHLEKAGISSYRFRKILTEAEELIG